MTFLRNLYRLFTEPLATRADLLKAEPVVTRFNGRTGNVVLFGQDVANALGYVPTDPNEIATVAKSGNYADLKGGPQGYSGHVPLSGTDVLLFEHGFVVKVITQSEYVKYLDHTKRGK